MTEYTRVTIQGEGRKADLVLPDDEPIAAVLPDVLSLLDETTERSARPVVLMTTVGEQLSPSLTLAEQAVEHGTILRLVRVDEAPPPPEVADVTDLMGEAVASRGDAWRPMWGTLAAAVVAGAAAVLGSVAGVVDGLTELQLGAGVVLVAVVAVVLARRGRTAPAVVLTASAVGALWTLTSFLLVRIDLEQSGATLLVWFGLACVLLAALGTLGFRERSLGLGGAVGAVLVAGWVVMPMVGVQMMHATAWIAIAGIALLGVLPGLAMAASGLTGLDDRVVEGQRVARPAVERAVDATHRSLTAATIAAVVPVTAAAWLLARSGEVPGEALAGAVGVILLMRTQVLPLAPQRLALIAGSATAFMALAVSRLMTPQAVALVAAALVVTLAAITGARLSENTRARLRRFAGIVEMIAVIALLPLVLWSIGVFDDLILTFTDKP